MSDFITPVIKGFTDVLSPLRKGLSSAEDFELLLVKYGWDARIEDGQMGAINAAFAVEPLLVSVLEKLDIFVNGVNLDRAKASLELIIEVKNIADKLGKLSTSGMELPAPLNQGAFWDQISIDLLADLLSYYFEKRQPIIYAIFHFSGIITYEKNTPIGLNRLPYTQTRLDFGKLGEFFSAPFDLFKTTYKWNLPGQDFDHLKLFKTLERIMLAFRTPAMLNLPREHLADKFLDLNQIGIQDIRELAIPIIDGISPTDDSYWRLGFVLLPIPDPAKDNGKIKGLAVVPLLDGELTTDIYFSNDVYLKLSGAFDAGHDISIQLLPNNIIIDDEVSDVAMKAAFELIGDPKQPWVLLGAKDSSRIELGGFKILFALAGTVSDPEAIFSIGTGDSGTNRNPRLSFVFDPSAGDSFITKVLGEDGFNVDFQSNLIWSSRTGLSFEGQAGFEIELPIHLGTGLTEVTTLHIALKGGKAGGKASAKADFGIGIKGELGPLSFVIENIGASLQLNPVSAGETGLLGSHDLSFGFKPPSGLGLSINAGAVLGGGYLFFDPEREEYAGVLELTIAGFVSAKAIGLITTKMPDGSKGFSMLIIITAEFNPPFQLGFGFTLMGVGGLLGLNRTVLLDPLREGIRTGAVNSIMFPQNVIANAPRIISDLKTIFPSHEGKFLVGPMGKLGWGTPKLISLSLGLIIEIPGKLAILGVLKIALPDEKVPLVKIQVAFLGTIDFDKKLLTFDASLFESSLLGMTLEGDMAVRMKWGDQPDFLLSVGGFHPSYTPPPLALPTLRRLAINILNTNIAKIRVECYQAVTSNTVQFGAKAEVYFDLKACSINGHIAFDALFQFSPFYFMIQLSSGFSMKVAGLSVLSVRVKMSLEGPTPWRAKGTGKVSLLFFSVSADFDKTWGDRKDTSLPNIEILPRFIKELQKKEQWNTLLASNKNLFVSLRKLEETAAPALVLHPSGTLVVQQRLLPLSVGIDRIGSQKTSDVTKVVISKATSGSISLVTTPVDEYFARAQYQQLSDAEKLSKPSFEKMTGGVAITMGKNHMDNGKMVRKKVEYEVTIVDKVPRKPFKFGVLFAEIAILFTNSLRGNAVAKSIVSQQHLQKLQPFNDKLKVIQEGYTVAFQSTNKAYATTATFSSEMMAQTYMYEQINKNPVLKTAIHVVPNYELQENE